MARYEYRADGNLKGREKDTSVEKEVRVSIYNGVQNLPQLEWDLERIQQRRNKLRNLGQIE